MTSIKSKIGESETFFFQIMLSKGQDMGDGLLADLQTFLESAFLFVCNDLHSPFVSSLFLFSKENAVWI